MHTVRPRRRGALLVAAGATATALAAAGTVTVFGGAASAREPRPAAQASTRAEADGGLTAEQRRRADQMISTFENSTTQLPYGYAENLHDGRGVTAGRAGFGTGTGDALLVVAEYTRRKPANPLARFLPELSRLARGYSDDTSRLPERAYLAAWEKAADDAVFRAAQDEVSDDLYFAPAMHHADRAGLKTALARAQVYDATIQHGDGDDPDGVRALLARTKAAAGGTPATGVDEKVWLERFFQVRIADLRNPAYSGIQDEWASSVDRVTAMRAVAAAGNYDLAGPIRFSVYGDHFTVD